MQKFYVEKKTASILNEEEFDNNQNQNDCILLGEFIDKSQARRHYYMTYNKEVN